MNAIDEYTRALIQKIRKDVQEECSSYEDVLHYLDTLEIATTATADEMEIAKELHDKFFIH